MSSRTLILAPSRYEPSARHAPHSHEEIHLSLVLRGALRFRWGVLEGPTEVYDADKDQLRFEIAGSGSVMTFRFDGAESAKTVEIGGGVVFTRR
jgi:hypothetical protein